MRSLISPPFHAVLDSIEAGEHQQYWLKGGRGSTKSSFVSLALAHGITQHPGTHGLALRKVKDNLASSVAAQLLWAIDMLGQTELWKSKVSPLELEYLPTGQKIYFRGADEPSKIKSIKLRNGYFRWIWFEEFDQFDGEDEVRKILQSLIRGGDRFSVFCSYNPPKSANNWTNAAAMEPRKGRLVHHSDYRDVPPDWLGSAFIADAEELRQRKDISYRHEYLGEVTGTGGAVFDNLTLRAITDEEIARFANHYRGLDFGFAVDPTSYHVYNYERASQRLYCYHEFYAAGAKYDQIAEAIQSENVLNGTVTADSAEPRSIAELQDRDINIVGAVKGPGSVEHGIKWMQDLDEIVIDPARCPNAAREYKGYEYAKDKHGNFRADFPDRDNHSIDDGRYACEDIAQPDPNNTPASAKGHRIGTAHHKKQQGKRFA